MSRKISKAEAETYVHAARVNHEQEGVLEVDEPDDARTLLSETDAEAIRRNGGVYVKAWVWISHEEATECASVTKKNTKVDPLNPCYSMPIRLELAARFYAAGIANSNEGFFYTTHDSIRDADRLIETYNKTEGEPLPEVK